MDYPREIESESVIRYYIPVWVRSLADIFSQIMDKVQGTESGIHPRPLGALLRFYTIEDHLVNPDECCKCPEKAVAWRLVTRTAAGEIEADIRIIADEVISMKTLKACNPKVFESLEEDGYVALARNGNDVFIPLRSDHVVTGRNLCVIFGNTSSHPQFEQTPVPA